MEQTKSLWQLLNEKDVIIPIIQRDYAQGRKSKYYVRQSLLKSFHKALDPSNANPESITMDFVYGSTDNKGRFCPLDGQQRLTTLWLLHWYVCMRSGNMSAGNNAFLLSRFSYATRTSSSEFCKGLTSMDKSCEKAVDIVAFIKKQKFFHNEFLQDPSVVGMLRMLSGDETHELDGISKVWPIGSDFGTIWQRLTNGSGQINFFIRDLNDRNIPLSDDIYIKMNARGKQLTDCENFKTDLFSYRLDDETSLFEGSASEQLQTKSLWDNEWISLFWTSNSSLMNHPQFTISHNTDKAFYYFLRNFFLNLYIAEYAPANNLNVKSIKNAPIYQEIYKHVINDVYTGLDIYTDLLSPKTIKRLKLFFSHYIENRDVVDKYILLPYWVKGKEGKRNYLFTYPLEIDTNGEVKLITQMQRIVFYALLKYLERIDGEGCSFDEKKFSEWMRFVWNIIKTVNTEDAMIGGLQFFAVAGNYAEDISIKLQDETVFGLLKDKGYATEQLYEERAKACLRHNQTHTPSDTLSNLRSAIDDAESDSFFHGSIRCLLWEWKEMDGEHRTGYVRPRGDETPTELEELYAKVLSMVESRCSNFEKHILHNRKEANLAFIRTIHDYDGVLYDNPYLYNISKESWQILVNHGNYAEGIIKILETDDLSTIQNIPIDCGCNMDNRVYANNIKNILLSEDFYSSYLTQEGSTDRLKSYGSFIAFYQYGHSVLNFFDWGNVKRNELYQKLVDCNVIKNDVSRKMNVIRDYYINVNINGIRYRWSAVNEMEEFDSQSGAIKPDSKKNAVEVIDFIETLCEKQPE